MSSLNDLLEDYLAVAQLTRDLGGSLVSSDDTGLRAVSYATAGWRVFPLRPRSKQPMINNAHPEGDPLRGTCTGECGRDGHGFHDATTDLTKVFEWWGIRYPGAGIGWVPDWDNVVVLDLDRHKEGQDGVARFKQLTGEEARFADTMRVRTGGGGLHLFYRRPDGDVTGRILTERFGVGHGVDIRTNGFLVAPGSTHPDSGKLYEGAIEPISVMPEALRRVVVEPPRVNLPRAAAGAVHNSIADWFTSTATWESILEPHGWVLIGNDGDRVGARWRHPTATAPWSAIVDEHGNLHVFSPNTPFEPSQGRNSGTGYTKFRAFAVLNFAGDMTRAAIVLQEWRWEQSR